MLIHPIPLTFSTYNGGRACLPTIMPQKTGEQKTFLVKSLVFLLFFVVQKPDEARFIGFAFANVVTLRLCLVNYCVMVIQGAAVA